jgi:hypothetical protein
VLDDAYAADCPTLLSGWLALQEQYAAASLMRS